MKKSFLWGCLVFSLVLALSTCASIGSAKLFPIEHPLLVVVLLLIWFSVIIFLAGFSYMIGLRDGEKKKRHEGLNNQMRES